MYGVRVSWRCVKWQWGDQCARNMAEELVVTLNRGDSSGFGFSLLGTAGLPHVIYDIVENSPAAKSGKVSTTYWLRSYFHIYLTYSCGIVCIGLVPHSQREWERGREREVRGQSKVHVTRKSNPSFYTRIVYMHLTLCIRYAFVRESYEREGPQNNARCISTRVIIASTLCRPVCFLTSDYFLFSRFCESCFLVLLLLVCIQ